MKYCMITFRSVTPAQRGEGILKKAAIAANLGRTPRQMQERGCGYSIRLRCQDIPEALALLREHGIVFQKVYSRMDDGKVEEWSL